MKPSGPTLQREVHRFAPAVSHYFEEVQQLLDRVDPEQVGVFVDAILEVSLSNRAVFLIGNGGSAAASLHLAADLGQVRRYGGPRIDARSLNANPAVMTAWSNDVSYDDVFVAQLETQSRPGDALVVISGSGDSPNCVRGARWARAKGLTVLGLLGSDGGSVARFCDFTIVVDSQDHLLIEACHTAVAHSLTRCLRG